MNHLVRYLSHGGPLNFSCRSSARNVQKLGPQTDLLFDGHIICTVSEMEAFCGSGAPRPAASAALCSDRPLTLAYPLTTISCKGNSGPRILITLYKLSYYFLSFHRLETLIKYIEIQALNILIFIYFLNQEKERLFTIGKCS